MNAKLSLVAATAVAALAAGVPVAFGGGQVGGASDTVRDRGFESVAGAKVEPAAVVYFRANELATAASSNSFVERDRGFESVAGAKVEPAAVAYFRANELATAAASNSFVERDRGFESVAGAKVEPAAVAYFRANELATAAASDSIVDASTSNGTGIGIAWAQIGIAFGVGFLLAVGLVVARRIRPSPPLAQ